MQSRSFSRSLNGMFYPILTFMGVVGQLLTCGAATGAVCATESAAPERKRANSADNVELVNRVLFIGLLLARRRRLFGRFRLRERRTFLQLKGYITSVLWLPHFQARQFINATKVVASRKPHVPARETQLELVYRVHGQ